MVESLDLLLSCFCIACHLYRGEGGWGFLFFCCLCASIKNTFVAINAFCILSCVEREEGEGERKGNEKRNPKLKILK
jgi:hypothetical protein